MYEYHSTGYKILDHAAYGNDDDNLFLFFCSNSVKEMLFSSVAE